MRGRKCLPARRKRPLGANTKALCSVAALAQRQQGKLGSAQRHVRVLWEEQDCHSAALDLDDQLEELTDEHLRKDYGQSGRLPAAAASGEQVAIVRRHGRSLTSVALAAGVHDVGQLPSL